MLASLERAEAEGRAYDVRSLKEIVSADVMFSREVNEGLLRFADCVIVDALGATEGGMATAVTSRATG